MITFKGFPQSIWITIAENCNFIFDLFLLSESTEIQKRIHALLRYIDMNYESRNDHDSTNCKKNAGKEKFLKTNGGLRRIKAVGFVLQTNCATPIKRLRDANNPPKDYRRLGACSRFRVGFKCNIAGPAEEKRFFYGTLYFNVSNSIFFCIFKALTLIEMLSVTQFRYKATSIPPLMVV
uniref:Uncharacterized protein n=1 Tax=Strongyloides venezuelensis TaxID=75913 RepID=A0A0K0EZ08_STRVS